MTTSVEDPSTSTKKASIGTNEMDKVNDDSVNKTPSSSGGGPNKGDFSTISIKFVNTDGRIVPNLAHEMDASGLMLGQLSKSKLSRKQRSWIDPLEPAIQNSFYEKNEVSNTNHRPDFKSVDKIQSMPQNQLSGLFDASKQKLSNEKDATSINNNNNDESLSSKREEKNEMDKENYFDIRDKLERVGNNSNETNESSDTDEETVDDSLKRQDTELLRAENDAEKAKSGKKFGAWDGVFTGCILNIFGVIMFLRVGWIVGQAGVLSAIGIILISSTVTFLTTLSMSAICTNGTILSGGAYYIISRSLGPAIGGSVGIMFSLGNMVAVSLYLIGFAETLVSNLGDPIFTKGKKETELKIKTTKKIDNKVNDVRIWSNIVLCFELFLALIGLKYVVKANLALLVLILVTIVMFFIGSFYQTSKDSDGDTVIYGIKGWGNGNLAENMTSDYVDGYGFWSVLSIFFPAVTGIMAGANISGDLEDPSRDIPLGTLAAVMLSTVTYSLMAFFVGAVTARSELISNVLVMADVAVLDWMVLLGVYAATLSSGIAALVGAPRILQAVAQDGIIDLKVVKFFAAVDSEGNPVRGYFLSFLVAAGCNCIGELNFVAPLISQFFMIAYLMLNLSCFAMEISKTPNWRPNFKYFNKYCALLGFLLCFTVMFLIDYLWALITAAIGVGIFVYIYVKDPNVEWGSAISSRNYYELNRALLRLRRHKMHVKNWRPNILVLIKKIDIKRRDSSKSSSMIVTNLNNDNSKNMDASSNSDITQVKNFGNLNLVLFAQTLRKAYAPLFFGSAIVIKNKRKNNKNLNMNNNSNVSNSNSASASNRTNVKEWNTAKLPSYANGVENNTDNISVLNSTQNDGLRRAIRYSQNDGYLPEYLKDCNGFYNTILCEKLRFGACNLMRSSGIGSMRPNTVMIGFLNKWQEKDKSELDDYVEILRDSLSSNMGVIIATQGFETSINFNSALQTPANIVSSLDGIIRNREDYGQKAGVIDVWWLLDDGGLCVLLPHIMKQDQYWKNYKLRLNLIVDKSDILNSGVTDVKMIESLIHTQFRLSFEKEARVIYVEQNEASEEMIEKYENLIKSQGMGIKDVARPNVVKRWLRLAELLYFHSKESSVAIVSLPLPTVKFDAKAYIALLHCISDPSKMPPMLIIRGSGESSLTFYSD